MENIKSNELRLGNIVKYHNDDTIFNVIGIDDLGIRVKNEEEETWIEYDCFSPIQITEGWLLKFGFEIKKTPELIEYSLIKRGFMFSIYRKIGYDVFFLSQYSEVDKGIMGTTQIKSVHQLQNLFFALTEEDLILK